MSLKGKVALVTGSTSGIGLGIAHALAAEGADMMMNGFGDPAAIADLQAQTRSRFGVRVGFYGGDISKPADAAAMVAQAQCRTRQPGHPGQQRRRPVHRRHRGFPRRAVGADHRHQPVRRVLHA